MNFLNIFFLLEYLLPIAEARWFSCIKRLPTAIPLPRSRLQTHPMRVFPSARTQLEMENVRCSHSRNWAVSPSEKREFPNSWGFSPTTLMLCGGWVKKWVPVSLGYDITLVPSQSGSQLITTKHSMGVTNCFCCLWPPHLKRDAGRKGVWFPVTKQKASLWGNQPQFDRAVTLRRRKRLVCEGVM